MRKPRPEIRIKLRKTADHGQNVYAFCNVRTNQVVYSLHDRLINEDLKQLPDAGANHNPPAVRPDLWKLFYSVHVPRKEQGLRLLAKLKEWRKVHELYWEPPTELVRSYTNKQVKQVKESLEERGGSKRETVYDVIKRQKKKLRQKIILDQKANSVADLSAVLHDQESQVVAWASEAKEFVMALAERASNGELQRLEKRVKELRETITNGVQAATRRERGVKVLELSRQLRDAKLKIAQMKFALGAVQEAKSWAELPAEEQQLESRYWDTVVASDGEYDKRRTQFAQQLRRACHQSWPQIAVARRAQGIKVDLQAWQGGAAAGEVEAGAEAEQGSEDQTMRQNVTSVAVSRDAEEQEVDEYPDANDFLELRPDQAEWERFVPSLPPALNPGFLNGRRAVEDNVVRNPDDMRGFPLQDVVVKWADVFDAEYAASWPEPVQIERMDGRSEKFQRYLERKQKEHDHREKWRQRYLEAKQRVQAFTGKAVDVPVQGADLSAEVPLDTPGQPGELRAGR